MATATTIATLCEDLSATLKEFAETARALRDRDADLPATLTIQHIAKHQNCSTTTAWRKAKLGKIDGLISAPDEPMRFDRDAYLAGRRKRCAQAG